MFRIRIFICILLASAFAAGAGAGPALASHNETTYFEGSRELLSGRTREHAISQLQHLGVRALRVELYWVDVAPSPKSASPPRFDATNPGYYNWGAYDWLLSTARQLNWQVLLTVTGPVPKWATSTHRPGDGQQHLPVQLFGLGQQPVVGAPVVVAGVRGVKARGRRALG